MPSTSNYPIIQDIYHNSAYYDSILKPIHKYFNSRFFQNLNLKLQLASMKVGKPEYLGLSFVWPLEVFKLGCVKIFLNF